LITSKGKLLRFDLATGKTTPMNGASTRSRRPGVQPDGKSLALLAIVSFGRPAPVVGSTGKRQDEADVFLPDGGAISARFAPDGST